MDAKEMPKPIAAPSDESRESSKEKNLGLLTEWDFDMPRNNRFHDPIQPQKNVVADESRERFEISDADRKRLLLLLGSEMDKAGMTSYPGTVINPVLCAMLRAERDTRELCAQLAEKIALDLQVSYEAVISPAGEHLRMMSEGCRRVAERIRGKGAQ